MSQFSLDQLRRAFASQGVRRAYAKFLAPNDNSKNQVYLGGDFGILNVLPAEAPVATRPSEASRGKSIFTAPVNLRWLGDDGTLHVAPGAKLIFYPQFPEVRLSGYLAGVTREHRPSEWMGTTRVPGRVLVFGVRDDRSIIAYAAGPDSVLAAALRDIRRPEMVGVLIAVPMQGSVRQDSRSKLLTELCRVSRRGWIASKRLGSDGLEQQYRAPNGGGYTLEAELGIRPNGRADPDFEGWEVKQHAVPSFDREGSGRITLMTPEPNDGLYVSEGVVRFVERYGYPALDGTANRRNFGGTFCAGQREDRTKLTLRLLGFDSATQKITDASGGLALVDDVGREAAVWRYASLMKHWNRKHASAAFVPSCKRVREELCEYRYSGKVGLGIGTSFDLLLASIDASAVYLDPAIKVVGAGRERKVKRRSQFRTKLQSIPALYSRFETAAACG